MQVRAFNPESTPKPSRAEGLPARILERLEIEIGCGVGMHPLQHAAQNSATSFIALEHTHERFGKFQRSYEAKADLLQNLHPRHANAVSWISHHVGPESVDHYWILYPNPNPKKKHRNLRWHAMPFAQYLVKTLKKGGRITVATNLKFYADEAIQDWQQLHGLKLIESTELVLGAAPRTHFEKKYLERGETCFNMVFERPY